MVNCMRSNCERRLEIECGRRSIERVSQSNGDTQSNGGFRYVFFCITLRIYISVLLV